MINDTFKNTMITVVFFQNNIPIPPVVDRFKIIKGITKTYALHTDRLRLYWMSRKETYSQ